MPPIYPVNIPIFNLLVSLSEAMDLVSRVLVNHHKQVSYLAFHIGKALGLPRAEVIELAMAGALHDVGGLSLGSRIRVLDFELSGSERHTVPGYLLLRDFSPFAAIAEMIRFHHVHWQHGAGGEFQGKPVPVGSHILHLADRIAICINPEQEILQQVDSIIARVAGESGSMFVPEQVAVFRELASRESFWFDLSSPAVCSLMTKRFPFGSMTLDRQQFLDLTDLFRRIIDFRSRFTVTHSSGVAVVAHALAQRAGMSEEDCHWMRIAGHMHDIGKLAVPTEILEKAGPLTKGDFFVIRKHPYLSSRILEAIDEEGVLREWAAYHHERLDGKGYPFHVGGGEMSQGARIMAVADTFTALTEVRPYRTGLSGRGALQIMDKMTDYDKLDGDILALVRQEIETINDIREAAQKRSGAEHKRFLAQLEQELVSQPNGGR